MLDRDAIARPIPHQGAMCLLDRVVSHDPEAILCLAHSHTALDNPLRNEAGLPITAGIEYAAQAIAVHAALRRREGGPAGRGYLAVLSDVRWSRDRLDDIPGPLEVRAALLADAGGGLQYRFSVGAAGAEPALEGAQVIARA